MSLKKLFQLWHNKANLEKVFPLENVVWFAYGRDALFVLARYLQEKGVKEIMLPSYVCDVAILPFIDKLKIVFYELNDSLITTCHDIIKNITEETGCVMLVDYFGFAQPFKKEISELCKNKNIVLIEDLAHKLPHFTEKNMSSEKVYGDFAIYSPRKQLPLSDGSLLYIKNAKEKQNFITLINKRRSIYRALRTIAKLLRSRYFSQQIDAVQVVKVEDVNIGNNLNKQWGSRNKAEGFIISRVAAHFIRRFDMLKICQRRIENHKYYTRNLVRSKNIVHIRDVINNGDVPYMYPVMLLNIPKNIKKILINELSGYFWPRLFTTIKNDESKFTTTKLLAENIYLLPLHQDLSNNDLETISQTFNKILAEYL